MVRAHGHGQSYYLLIELVVSQEQSYSADLYAVRRNLLAHCLTLELRPHPAHLIIPSQRPRLRVQTEDDLFYVDLFHQEE